MAIAQNKSLRSFLTTRKFYDEDLPLTHMYFGKKIWKLSIPDEVRPTFYEAYIQYCHDNSEDILCSTGHNCISEKVPRVFKFYVDLELKVDNFVDGVIDYKDVATLMNKTREMFCTVLREALGVNEEVKVGVISAFRMFYKCHLYFPDFVFDAKQAESICLDVEKRLLQQYPWITKKESKFIDTSVYKTGLRILFSHKGSLEKSSDHNKHVEYFKGAIPYQYYYQVGELHDDGTIVYEKHQRTVEMLEKVSIIPPKGTDPLVFVDEYKPVVKSRLRRVTMRLSPRQSEGTSEGDQEDSNVTEVSTSEGEDHGDADLQVLKCLVREYVQDVIPTYRLNPNFRDLTINDYGSIIVILEPQVCPFIFREHKRTSEKNVSATFVVMNAFECTLRCFDEECTDIVTLPSPKEELLSILCTCTKDFVLKRSLYKQTHETVAEYIFSLVKDTYATSPANASLFLWYYYEEKEHRWIQQEKIMTTIMSENGLVQRAYRAYVERMKHDASLTEDDKKTTKDLWNKLEEQLQTTGFVRSGIMPLLARKLEQYWSKTIKTVAHPLKQGKGATFQSTLDDNPNLMGFTNGVWDFHKRVFRQGRPIDFISMSTNLKYLPYNGFSHDVKDALSSFLKKIYPKDNHLDYVMGEIASCLHGTVEQQRFFLMTGRGANGKSTLVRLLNLSFGDYAGEVNITLFTKQRPPANQPTPELIAIKGQRFISSAEPNARDPFNLGTIKWLTGGDRITAAQKYEKNQSFYLQGTFFSLINDIPPIQASKDDNGTWRRMKPVEHYARFVRDPNPDNPLEFKDDMTINQQMEKWKEVFIAYLIQIFLENRVRKEPEEFVKLHLKLQGDSDVFSRFHTQFIIKDEDNFMDLLALFEGFTGWNKIARLSKKDISINQFEKHMLNLVGPYVEDEDGNKGWNISLKRIPNMSF